MQSKQNKYNFLLALPSKEMIFLVLCFQRSWLCLRCDPKQDIHLDILSLLFEVLTHRNGVFLFFCFFRATADKGERD